MLPMLGKWPGAGPAGVRVPVLVAFRLAGLGHTLMGRWQLQRLEGIQGGPGEVVCVHLRCVRV